MTTGKRKTKHPLETIQKAIALWEGGMALTAIAKELEVKPSTAQYWIQNPARFLAKAEGPVTTQARMLHRFHREIWDIKFLALKELKEKLSEGGILELLKTIRELDDIQSKSPAFAQKNEPQGEKFSEGLQRVKLEVETYLQKKESPVSGLSARPVVEAESVSAVGEAVSPEASKETRNGAT